MGRHDITTINSDSHILIQARIRNKQFTVLNTNKNKIELWLKSKWSIQFKSTILVFSDEDKNNNWFGVELDKEKTKRKKKLITS